MNSGKHGIFSEKIFKQKKSTQYGGYWKVEKFFKNLYIAYSGDIDVVLSKVNKPISRSQIAKLELKDPKSTVKL